jgi:hypothetical protein
MFWGGEQTLEFCVLIKIGQRRHIEELRSSGVVLMQPLRYFRKLEGDTARGDNFEGSLQIVQPQHVTISIDLGGGEVPADVVGPVVIGADYGCNVFCMYSITKSTDLVPISPKIKSFGDSFVMITKTQEFIGRLHAAANRAGFKCEYRLVEYIDVSARTGRTGLFRKPSDFAYQNEYRFAVLTDDLDPIRLNLGSLSDITTEVLPTRDICELRVLA